MTKSQIIKLVQARTENSLVGVVDFDDLLNDVIQELCAEFRFWWLKKRLSFSTAAGTATYDLSSIVTSPAGAGPYVDEITGVVLIDSSGNPCKLVAIFDDLSIASAVTDATTGQPGSYTIETNDLSLFQTLRLMKIPNGIYTVHVFFWAMPNPDADADSSDEITVIPATKHHILKTGLEKEILRIKYGEQDPKYVTALNEYNKKVEAAKVRPSFSAERELFFENMDGEAIRSTR